jgi:hypothetical protein
MGLFTCTTPAVHRNCSAGVTACGEKQQHNIFGLSMDHNNSVTSPLLDTTAREGVQGRYN